MWKYTPSYYTNQRVEIIQFWFVTRIEKRQKFVSDRQIKPKASGNPTGVLEARRIRSKQGGPVAPCIYHDLEIYFRMKWEDSLRLLVSVTNPHRGPLQKVPPRGIKTPVTRNRHQNLKSARERPRTYLPEKPILGLYFPKSPKCYRSHANLY